MTELNRKIVIAKRGGPERLKLVEEAVPVAGPGEVLIRNEAVGVAFADVLIREGIYPGVPLPATPGYEVVGRIIARGQGVREPEVGARVAALTVHRGYASHVTVPAEDCVVVPDALSSAHAAALVLNGLTAYQMLTRCVPLPSNRKMLVWGAAGGVGSILLELGRHFGIETFGVASSSRLEHVRAQGSVPIDRSAGDVADAVRRASAGGVDAVFDGVGGPNVRTSLRALRDGGTVVMFGVQGALDRGRLNPIRLAFGLLRTPRFSAQRLFMSNRALRGYMIEGWKRAHPDFYRADLAQLLRLAADGAITPAIHAELPLESAAQAHAMINAGAQTGKIILRA